MCVSVFMPMPSSRAPAALCNMSPFLLLSVRGMQYPATRPEPDILFFISCCLFMHR